jgi:hypothetical protein
VMMCHFENRYQSSLSTRQSHFPDTKGQFLTIPVHFSRWIGHGSTSFPLPVVLHGRTSWHFEINVERQFLTIMFHHPLSPSNYYDIAVCHKLYCIIPTGYDKGSSSSVILISQYPYSLSHCLHIWLHPYPNHAESEDGCNTFLQNTDTISSIQFEILI